MLRGGVYSCWSLACHEVTVSDQQALQRLWSGWRLSLVVLSDNQVQGILCGRRFDSEGLLGMEAGCLSCCRCGLNAISDDS